jgi:DeoR family transcriptional regulator of aga operon
VSVSNTKEFASAGPRRQQLARLVVTRGFVRVAHASLELGVSEVTIRADLNALELAGSVVRVHGGAMPTSAMVDPETPLEASVDRDAAAKLAIGREAAALVSSGESVYVDAGSTAMALAAALVDRRELRDVVVVTPGLTIALALEAALPRFTVIVTGGTLRALQHSLVNPFAVPMIDSLNLDWAFIGCNGIHARLGVTNVNLPEAEIKSRVLPRSRRRVLIADATKLGRADLAVIAPIAEFETLVTAGDAEPGILAELTAAGLEIIRG